MHKATYDSHGNIILSTIQETNRTIEIIAGTQWNIVDPTGPALHSAPVTNNIKKPWFRFKESKPIVEISKQIQASKQEYKEWKATLHKGKKSIWQRLTQPVFIAHKNKPVKKYSRARLFIEDTIRFGFTFLLIFAVLFTILNYESFWIIAKEYINPLSFNQKQVEQTIKIDTAFTSKSAVLPGLLTSEGKKVSNPLTFLPAVGPPNNRLIIPKLGLNVPLNVPSYDALLTEDWVQLEKDIQDGLSHGVIHYPGTAKPGQTGNFFITGHSSYYAWAPGKYKSVFATLHQLNIGDEYFVYYGGDKFRYKIKSKTEVKPSNVHVLDQPLDERISTLMTCTPVGTTLRRLILVAEELDVITGEPLAVGENSQSEVKKINPSMLPI